MTGKAGFTASVAAGFFSVFLLGWKGYQGASADWVYGFLAVFWSLLMMLRLMTLTTPLEDVVAGNDLAARLIGSFRERQEGLRRAILETSFGGSFVLFLGLCLLFGAWQVFCAFFPAQEILLSAFEGQVRDFFAQGFALPDPLSFAAPFFSWGQGFLLLLSLAMMGFVLRSHAMQRGMTRASLLILSGYAVAGYIALCGLDGAAPGINVLSANLTGSGFGAAGYLHGLIESGAAPSLFDYFLLESGLAGIGLLTVILFVPLGYISLSVGRGRTDWMIVGAGMVTGSMMIFAAFLPFTPAMAGYMALCWMALFLAWGAVEAPTTA